MDCGVKLHRRFLVFTFRSSFSLQDGNQALAVRRPFTLCFSGYESVACKLGTSTSMPWVE